MSDEGLPRARVYQSCDAYHRCEAADEREQEPLHDLRPEALEFRTAAGEALAISIPRTKTAVIKYFQERMPLWAIRAR
jgi:hypothetical protein